MMPDETLMRDALCTIAAAAAQLRDLSYRDTADETREAHNVLAERIASLEERERVLTGLLNQCLLHGTLPMVLRSNVHNALSAGVRQND